MPAEPLSFRRVCGSFLATFHCFMQRRVEHALRMRKAVITVRTRTQLVYFVFVAAFLLCCGDVEMNPGPNHNQPSVSENNNDSSDFASSDIASKILSEIQSLGRKFEGMKTDISAIKHDIVSVKEHCHQIDVRCAGLEKENERCRHDIDYLKKIGKDNGSAIEFFADNMKDMRSEIAELKQEVDKLEGFSRRDNLRMYGVPSLTEGPEDYDACANAVVSVLNAADDNQDWQWASNDIVRAHRVGQSRDGSPRPMVVKFSRWRDKMYLLTSRQLRQRLAKHGNVRLANDLTRSQAKIAAQAREEGKVAYIKNGKMMVKPKTPDQRTYAEVADPGEAVHGRQHQGGVTCNPARNHNPGNSPTARPGDVSPPLHSPGSQGVRGERSQSPHLPPPLGQPGGAGGAGDVGDARGGQLGKEQASPSPSPSFSPPSSSSQRQSNTTSRQPGIRDFCNTNNQHRQNKRGGGGNVRRSSRNTLSQR